MRDERVDANLAKASTIPANWYTDPAVLRREEERVFGRTWQLAGLASKVDAPGPWRAAKGAAGHSSAATTDRRGASTGASWGRRSSKGWRSSIARRSACPARAPRPSGRSYS